MGESGGRSFRTWLAAIVGGGAVLRLVRLFATKWHQPLLLNDSLYYSAQAGQLAHGVWFHEVFTNQQGAEHGPLTPVLMSLVSWGSDPLDRQRLVTVACGVATVAVVGVVGRRVGGDRVGLLAAAIAALYPNLWINDGLVMSESVGCLLVTLTLLAALRWADRRSLSRAATWGGLVGLAALARSELLLLAPLAALLIVLVGRRRQVPVAAHALMVIGITLATIAPWTIFNAVRFDDPVLLTTNEGPLWLGANCPESYYGEALGGWSLFCVVDAHFGEHGEDTSVRSTEQRRAGLSYARHHLGRLPVVVVARIGRTLDAYAVGNLVHNDIGEERERWASWAGVVTFWLLVPLAVAGAWRLRRWYVAVLSMPVVVVAVTTIVFYGAHRVRSPAEPALVVLAAVGGARAVR